MLFSLYKKLVTIFEFILILFGKITIDNTALNRIAVENLRLADPDFTQINKFVISIFKVNQTK